MLGVLVRFPAQRSRIGGGSLSPRTPTAVRASAQRSRNGEENFTHAPPSAPPPPRAQRLRCGAHPEQLVYTHVPLEAPEAR